MKARIQYAKPSITELEVAYATEAARHGWGERCYEFINRFEEQFARYLGVEHAIATSSCTGALHMGLAALGIGPGDEVIVPDTTWIATVAPIRYLGATPVFVDILRDSWCIDPTRAREAITARTKAVIAVHLYGNLCEMDHLLALGEQHGIAVIEDAAEAIGSVWHGRRAGAMGKFAAFSFHGTKTLTTGEGGMFVTNDSELHERVMTLSNHGRSRDQNRQFWPDVLGFKYKMSNVQAAIGCAQLERVEELVQRKRDLFERYRTGCAGLPALAMNPEKPGTRNAYWMPTVVFDAGLKLTPDILLAAFHDENIDARSFFHPLSTHPLFQPATATTISREIAMRAINLPAYHDLREEEQQRVVETVLRVARGNALQSAGQSK